MKLVIGNKNYSSWSLRAWLLLKEANIVFDEIRIPLLVDGYKQEILKHTPSGKVPALITDEVTIWDSLAICEYIAELYPQASCWPRDLVARALARSVCNEMHSGFTELRNSLPMNCRLTTQLSTITDDLQTEIDRVCEIWQMCRQQYSREGEFLFGTFSIADAMYAPVVLRFRSYNINVGELQKKYMKNVLSLTSLQQWITAGVEEKEIMPDYE